ncbi:hypothetical protein EMMF5_004697 [Cystobasidiomycetes sp. EMM_F5]
MLKHLAVTIIMLMSVRSDDLMPITDVAQHPTLACDVPAAKDQSGMRTLLFSFLTILLENSMLAHLAVAMFMLLGVRSDDLTPVTDIAQHPSIACETPAAEGQAGMKRCGSDRSSIWVCSPANGWIQDPFTAGTSCLLYGASSRPAPCCSDNGNLNEVYCNAPAKIEGDVQYC